MRLERKPNWLDQLHQALDRAGQRSFAWGTFDCALHACDCILAVAGEDPAAAFRGKYQDERGAAEIYGASLEAFIAKMAADFGCDEVPPTMARRGDVIWIQNDTLQGALGVVSLDGRFASCATDRGLVLVRMDRWKRAWRVG